MMGMQWGESFKDDAQNCLNPSSSAKNGWFGGNTNIDHQIRKPVMMSSGILFNIHQILKHICQGQI